MERIERKKYSKDCRKSFTDSDFTSSIISLFKKIRWWLAYNVSKFPWEENPNILIHLAQKHGKKQRLEVDTFELNSDIITIYFLYHK